MPASTELARLRAHADGFHVLADELEALRRRRAAADTEVMRQLIEDCRLWVRNLRSGSSYRECVAWWYRCGRARRWPSQTSQGPYSRTSKRVR
ncbi:hypothetical protein ACAG26_22180 [Mycobacterium sp. pUA109]|uniref:hypothetical protein n=1 Tax=Mycobacterium sp. pUA109 TaxID=3238982 RepID=UPI00351B4042